MSVAKKTSISDPSLPFRGTGGSGGRSLIIFNSHPIQYFAPLYRYLASEGVKLEVLYYHGKEQAGKYDKEFGQSVQWDLPLLDGYPHKFLKNCGFTKIESKGFFSLINPGLIRYLFKQPKSLVVIHSWQYATDWLAIIFAKLAGHRLALWTEVNAAQEALQPKWKQRLKALFLKSLFLFVREFWCIGSENRCFYNQLGVDPGKLKSTPYSVDNARFQEVAASLSKLEARGQLGLNAEAFIVLFAGKYIAKKRPMDLLQAFAGITQANAKLVMVGEGMLRGEMTDFIACHSLQDRVSLTGFVNQTEIPLYYRAADLFVMCSGNGETWGLSVNEAMNFSLPVLVSSLSGCSADLVKQGVNGFVFNTGDTAALRQYLEEFILMPTAELEAMGAASLKIVSGHSFETIRRSVV
ncbi:MAG: glycosyltransferase family 4 protein [Bacteroidota bacterium]